MEDAYVELWTEVKEEDSYTGPDKFDKWAANLILRNSDQIGKLVEMGSNELFQQIKRGG